MTNFSLFPFPSILSSPFYFIPSSYLLFLLHLLGKAMDVTYLCPYSTFPQTIPGTLSVTNYKLYFCSIHQVSTEVCPVYMLVSVLMLFCLSASLSLLIISFFPFVRFLHLCPTLEVCKLVFVLKCTVFFRLCLCLSVCLSVRRLVC